ncbi:SAV_2336 N-terminal domain-related protein [Streptomyces sp. YU58]|uniref:SAV_2336 N-terminal domain-related protein n=1 Tax=Streptomyces sp. SX92 TaxID=3158972 RepID=UPI0027BA8F11|nr:SAV_2336 N-terminal domain-related protein [Streptomyces coralus]WLW52255.1 SAV_2336 N-terminal domain-related protein [Streptomyces coralus]
MSGPGADGPLRELAERLRVRLGVEPTPRELAEALWLAGHVGPAPAPTRPRVTGGPVLMPGPAQADDSGAAPPGSPRPVAETPGRDSSGRARLYADGPDTAPATASGADGPDGPASRVRVPAATTLPHTLRLQRALRPLQHYHPPVRVPAHLVDEQATAEQAAESRLLLPVLRATTSREARLRILMDVSSSTAVWDRTVEELRQICAGLGAFREVAVHHVREGPGGGLTVTTSREGTRGARAAEQLRDPTGRQLTLVLSDCAGPLWRSGRMQRLLHQWASAAPVAVVQPLPYRMWRRTYLPALPGVLRRREGLGVRLGFRPAEETPPEGALPVPVLAPTRTALGTWARLLAGTTGLSLPAAAGWVRADHPAVAAHPEQPSADAAALVRAFRATASRPAVSLAVSLSAVPLALPVMQLVQRATQPRSGPSVLAEVLLSGLLRRGDGDEWYVFAPGVREELLRLLPRGEALLVLRHCGAYVERHFGRRARNFPALALARLTGDTAVPDTDPGLDVPAAFAEVSELVVGRYARVPAVSPTQDHERGVLVCAEEDVDWAVWVRHLLKGFGHRPVIQPSWRPVGDGLSAEVALLMRDAAAQGQRVLVHVSGSALNALRIHDDVVEGAMAWHVLNQLGLDPTSYAQDASGPRFPGATRLVGRLPQGAPSLDGHEELVARLRRRLTSQAQAQEGRSAACAIVGPPGTGKMMLAMDYVRRYGDEYDVVWWVGRRAGRDDGASVRRQALAELATELGIAEGADWEAALRRLLREGRLRWLIVYEAWDTYEGPFDPLFDGGHVLITSRDTAWAHAVATLSLESGETGAGVAAEYDVGEHVRSAVVSVSTSDDRYVHSAGTGFFVAPGWVIACPGETEEATTYEVRTVHGWRYRSERVWRFGEMAVIRLRDADVSPCLWIWENLELTAPMRVYTASGLPGRIEVSATSVHVERGICVANDPLPPDTVGSPLVHASGAVYGMITGTDPRLGIHMESFDDLRLLMQSRPEGVAVWNEMLHAHDRFHARRLRVRDTEERWPDLYTARRAERIQLYGILAELDPPAEPDAVRDLLPEPRPVSPPPLAWREGAQLLFDSRPDQLRAYLERVAAYCASSQHPWNPAVADLHGWIAHRAWTGRDETLPVRHDTAVVVRVRSAGVASYDCRIHLLRNGEFSLRESLPLSGRSTLAGTLPSHLGEVLREAAHEDGSLPTVQFVLSRESLWDFPVEDLRMPHPDRDPELPRAPLWAETDVVVAGPRPQDQWASDARRRWREMVRGPLISMLLTADMSSTEVYDRLGNAPDNAVPVYCRHPDRPGGSTHLDIAQAMGFPLILWGDRRRHQDCSRFHDLAEDLVATSSCTAELLAGVRRMRASDAVGATGTGSRVGLLYAPPDWWLPKS